MLIKYNQSFRKARSGFFSSTILFFISITEIKAQVRSVPPPPPPVQSEDFTWWYISLFVLALGLAGAVLWWLNNKKAQKNSTLKSSQTANDEMEIKSLDADKEFEWLRKNEKLVGKMSSQNSTAHKRTNKASKSKVEAEDNETANENSTIDETEKNSSALPIFAIKRLELARPFDALPISDDEDLMSAVEQSYDESEEDEDVRDLAIRILAAFKKRNSVEALSQVALYDLSSNLRSKAVSVLAEFDHESVFETILVANADPTREVRAAAARGLTKLSFNRADAWTRIAETGEEGRITQAARAAIESGFVDMSFDRLVHADRKYAYEAFALMALLVRSGETEKIFGALENHRDMNVRKAVLHVIKITKDQRALDGLYALLEKNNLPIDFQEEVDRTIEEIGFVTA